MMRHFITADERRHIGSQFPAHGTARRKNQYGRVTYQVVWNVLQGDTETYSLRNDVFLFRQRDVIDMPITILNR